MTYLEQVQRGMDLLASHPNSIFVGQAMRYKGHAISRQVDKYPENKLLEVPVMEDSQAGICLGLAIEGYVPINCYPRCNFSILACNQLINHIDKWKELTGQTVKIVTKIVVGSTLSLDPGCQHKANYWEAFDSMCEFIPVYNLTRTSDQLRKEDNEYVLDVYDNAYHNSESCIIVEDANLY